MCRKGVAEHPRWFLGGLEGSGGLLEAFRQDVLDQPRVRLALGDGIAVARIHALEAKRPTEEEIRRLEELIARAKETRTAPTRRKGGQEGSR